MNQPINHGILESDLNLNGYGFVNIDGVLGTFQPRSSVLDELADTSPSYVGIQLLQFAAPGVDSLLGIHSNGVPYYAAGSGYVPTSRAVNTQSPLDGGGALTGDLTLSISAAGQFNDGYLSAADWNTFSGKQNALGFTPEPALGNPGTSGFVLSSTMGGVRSWVASPLAVDVTASNWIRSYNPTTGAFTSSRPAVADLSNANILALLASPAFTGTPTAPTASGGTNTTQIATTAFVTSAVSAAGSAPFVDSTAIIKGSSDATKLLRIEVDGFTTGTTRVLTPPNYDGTIATLAGSETFTNKAITAPTISGGTHIGITSFGIRSTLAAFDLKLASTEGLSADRTLNIDLQNGNRAFTLGGDLSVVGAAVLFNADFTVSQDIVLTSDGTGTRTLNIAAGGTLGSNAFTSTAYAPLASPAFTGDPTAPTQTPGDNSTKLATTAYVDANAGGAAKSSLSACLANGTIATLSGTMFFAPNMTFATGSFDHSDENTFMWVAPFAGTLKNLNVRTGSQAKEETPITVITVRKNGADTTLTVTIVQTINTTTTDSTHSVTLAAGDRVTISAATSGTDAVSAGIATITLEYDSL